MRGSPMCKSTDNIFYVYVYLDPRKPEYRVYGNYEFDYEPFYVGKGCNDRAYSHLKGNRYNRHFTNKINKIRKETGADPFIIKVHEGLTEDISFELEKELICVIGRHDQNLGPLCNHTDGGDGASGIIVNEETRQKRSYMLKEFYHTTEEGKIIRNKISNKLKGKIVSEETRKKMSKAQKGHRVSEKTRQMAIKTHTGKIVSEETRKKRSNALKGHIVTQEQIQKTKETCLKKRLEREANKLPKPPKWLITYPNGTTIKVVNLNKFCKENGLLRQGLHNLTKGHGKTYKGFKCEKIQLEIISKIWYNEKYTL